MHIHSVLVPLEFCPEVGRKRLHPWTKVFQGLLLWFPLLVGRGRPRPGNGLLRGVVSPWWSFCWFDGVLGEVAAVCHSDLSPDNGAIGYRVPKESFVGALVRSVFLSSGIANPPILHHWAIVGASTVARALLLEVKVPAEGQSSW